VERVEVVLPRWGPNMVSAVLLEWLRQVGDRVQAGEPLCRVETEKITTEVEAPAAGVLREILVRPGEEVEVGTVLCRIEVG
jgi:pyruvate/2-oxoglutarate dehydrogenase complex dihydrolipoamide acyltransferase (E2) component